MLTWSLVLLLVGLTGCTAVPRQEASTQQPQPSPPARETPSLATVTESIRGSVEPDDLDVPAFIRKRSEVN